MRASWIQTQIFKDWPHPRYNNIAGGFTISLCKVFVNY